MKSKSPRAGADPAALLVAEAERLFRAGEPGLAEQRVRAVLAAHPDHVEGLHMLGVIANAAHRYTDAEQLLRRALGQRRGAPGILNNLGLALQAQGKIDEAIRLFRRAVAAQPANAVLHLNLGSALKDGDDIASAMISLTRAITLDPALADARFGRALCLLAQGRIEDAWHEHEWRRTSAMAPGNGVSVQRASQIPRATLNDCRLLVMHEQGMGDELFFLRYGPLIHAQGARIAYRGNPRLAPLLSRLSWLDTLLEPSAPPPAHDYALRVGDLPLLAAGDTAFPAAVALTVNGQLRTGIRERLAQAGPPPYLGVTWRAGNAALAGTERTLRKQIPLLLLAQTLSAWRGTLIVLQRAPADGEVQTLMHASAVPVSDFSDCNDDLDTMLAVLDDIDDYVGVSNTNMHLRAGLGKTARVLIPFPPEWRWTSTLDRSPWFPGFPLYREHKTLGWERALQQLRSEFECLAP
jgi:Tfp pilus assembly protein PilF